MKNPLLKKLYKDYKNHFRLQWKGNDTILVLDKDGKCHVLFIFQKENPDCVLISVNIASNEPTLISSIAVASMYSVPIRNTEPFYYDSSGGWFFGQEAENAYKQEIEFETIEKSEKVYH